MQIELADDPTAFLTADWTGVVMEDPHGTFFHTPAYLKLWWEEFGAGRLVIATGVDEGTVAGACVFQVEVEWERADLRGLADRAPWAGLLESAAGAQAFRTERGSDGVCPVLELPATYDGYLAALPSKL